MDNGLLTRFMPTKYHHFACFPLERRALRLGFFCPHWTPMIDSIYRAYPYLKKQTAARWPHVVLWRHCNDKMTSPCCISAYLGFSGSMFFQYKMRYLVVSKKKNPLFMWGWDRKIRPLWSPRDANRWSLRQIFQSYTHYRFLYSQTACHIDLKIWFRSLGKFRFIQMVMPGLKQKCHSGHLQIDVQILLPYW